MTSQLLPSGIKVTNKLAVWGLDWWCLQRSGMQSYHIDLCYVQSTAARVRDHAVEMAAKRRRRLAKVRSSEEFFCTVRSFLASFDRTIFSLACGLLQPRSQAPPSFPSLAVRSLAYSYSVLQATEGWGWGGGWERGFCLALPISAFAGRTPTQGHQAQLCPNHHPNW